MTSFSLKIQFKAVFCALSPNPCPDLSRASDWIGIGYSPAMCLEVVTRMRAAAAIAAAIRD